MLRSIMLAKVILLVALTIFAYAQTPRIAVIAHRGEHLHHPENTMAAFQAAVDAGADYFELDVRTTSDGKFVLMHDATVDRMTNGKGEVASMTFAQVSALEVKNGGRIPTFDEALEFAHGKIGVYVDSKRISAQEAIACIERHNMQDRVVIYGGVSYLKEISAARPKMKIMPEASDAAHLKSLIDALALKVVAFDAKDFTAEIIAVARAAKLDIYVDRLGLADHEKSWQDAIDRGATGIQTDHPAELAAYLKSKGYR